MNIEIWSDVACPFCFIGKKHLEKALEIVDIEEEVQVTFRSFQLDPGMPKSDERSIYEILASKYGRTVEWAKQANENVKAMAAQVGVEMNIDGIKPANTFDAHRLLHLAKAEGLQKEMKDALLSAYFVQGLSVSDESTLLSIAENVGLKKEEARTCLSSDQFTEAVQQDIAMAGKYGIQGVPFFLINQKYGISGAQPINSFVQALNQIAREG